MGDGEYRKSTSEHRRINAVGIGDIESDSGDILKPVTLIIKDNSLR